MAEPLLIDWTEPPAMDVGAPEPMIRQEGSGLLVSYFTRDNAVAVLRFDDVSAYSLGPPNDEILDTHPLYALGLKPYSFFEVSQPGSQQRDVRAATSERHWIATFHDDTLEVHAGSAWVLTNDAGQQSPSEAIRTIILSHQR